MGVRADLSSADVVLVESVLPDRAPIRRFATACATGAVLALVPFLLFLERSRSHWVGYWKPGGLNLDRFYDVQALALLHGRWNVPPAVVGFDGFRIGGKTVMYFGPFPAFLRMPLLEVARSLDGHLTPVSMTLAYLLALLGAALLLRRVRDLIRPDAPFGRGEWIATAAWIFVVGTSPLLYLGSEVWVYHEAVLWGVALSLLGLDSVAAFMERPSAWRLVRASLLGTCALLSRPSVGLATPIALAVAALVVLWRRARDRSGRFDTARLRGALSSASGVALAAAVPLVAFVGTLYAKFGTFLSVPWPNWVNAMTEPKTRFVVRSNHGTIISLGYFPSMLLQYARPDALKFSGAFPALAGRRRVPMFLGMHSIYSSGELPTSATDVMPLLLVLAVVGWWAFFGGRVTEACRKVMLPVVVGAALSILPTMITGSFSNRYLGDFVPFAVVPAALGVQFLVHAAPRVGRTRRVVVAVLLSLLAITGAFVNISLAIGYQRTVIDGLGLNLPGR